MFERIGNSFRYTKTRMPQRSRSTNNAHISICICEQTNTRKRYHTHNFVRISYWGGCHLLYMQMWIRAGRIKLILTHHTDRASGGLMGEWDGVSGILD